MQDRQEYLQEKITRSEFDKYQDFIAKEIAALTKSVLALEEENRNLRTLLAGSTKKNTERAAKLYMHLKMTGEPLFRTEASKILDNDAPEIAARAMRECEEFYADVVLKKHGRKKELFLILREDDNTCIL
jgi:cell division septum initiation protein DivIVA